MQLFRFLFDGGPASARRRQKDLHLMRMTFVFASPRREEPDGGYMCCAPGEIIITTSVWCAQPKQKNPRVCARPVGKTRLHTLLFESFVAAASVNQYTHIKIVKQMPISSTITAIFLKRYLIYQHKVSESAFFSYKNMCAAVSRWRAENCCRAEFYWASTFLSLYPCNFHVLGRNRGAHAAPTTTNNNCRAGIWRLVVR